MEQRLYAYLGGIARKNQSSLLKINGTENHIHLLLKLNTTIAISTLLKELKAYSSGWMKKEGYDSFGWQNGYGAFSYSKSHLSALTRYIENQKEHHQAKSFEEEIELLKKTWTLDWIMN